MCEKAAKPVGSPPPSEDIPPTPPKRGILQTSGNCRKKWGVFSSPLTINILKDQRMIDEKNMKSRRRNFTTPYEEFYPGYMLTANWNHTLVNTCFADNFKQRLEAFDTLIAMPLRLRGGGKDDNKRKADEPVNKDTKKPRTNQAGEGTEDNTPGPSTSTRDDVPALPGNLPTQLQPPQTAQPPSQATQQQPQAGQPPSPQPAPQAAQPPHEQKGTSDWKEVFSKANVSKKNWDKYAAKFVQEEVTVDLLPELSKQDLTQIGVTMGDAVRILTRKENQGASSSGRDTSGAAAGDPPLAGDIFGPSTSARGVPDIIDFFGTQTEVTKEPCLFEKAMSDKHFVDKTDIIEKLPHQKVYITAPPRSGKSTMIHMLKRFFEIEVDKDGKELTSKVNPGLFKNLAIMEKEEGKIHLGKHPVIRLNFNNLACSNKDELYNSFHISIRNAYMEHYYLYLKLNENCRKQFHKITSFTEKVTETDLISSLANLGKWLRDYFSAQVVVLVDEFEAPVIRSSFRENRPDSFTNEVYTLVYTALAKLTKDLEHLVFIGYLTGILHLSADDSDLLNNFSKHPFLGDHHYVTFFGLTETEIDKFCLDQDRRDKIKDNFNGYYNRTCTICIYTLQSVLSYLNKGTGVDELSIHSLVKNIAHVLHNRGVLEKIQDLLHNRSVEVNVQDKLGLWEVLMMRNTLSGSEHSDSDLLFSFLLQQGYLSYSDHSSDTDISKLVLPNKSVKLTLTTILSSMYKVYNITVEARTSMARFLEFIQTPTYENLLSWARGLEAMYSLARIDPEGEFVCSALLIGQMILWSIQSGAEVRNGRSCRPDFAFVCDNILIVGEVKFNPRRPKEGLNQLNKKGYVGIAMQGLGLNTHNIDKILKVAVNVYGKTCNRRKVEVFSELGTKGTDGVFKFEEITRDTK